MTFNVKISYPKLLYWSHNSLKARFACFHLTIIVKWKMARLRILNYFIRFLYNWIFNEIANVTSFRKKVPRGTIYRDSWYALERAWFCCLRISWDLSRHLLCANNVSNKINTHRVLNLWSMSVHQPCIDSGVNILF